MLKQDLTKLPRLVLNFRSPASASGIPGMTAHSDLKLLASRMGGRTSAPSSPWATVINPSSPVASFFSGCALLGPGPQPAGSGRCSCLTQCLPWSPNIGTVQGWQLGHHDKGKGRWQRWQALTQRCGDHMATRVLGTWGGAPTPADCLKGSISPPLGEVAIALPYRGSLAGTVLQGKFLPLH